VRVLAEDIGRELNCGGCLSALRREAVGNFTLAKGGVTLVQLDALTRVERDALLLPTDALVASLPSFDLDVDEARCVRQGRPLERPGTIAGGLARIYGPGREFLGVVEIRSPGLMIPRRLKSQTGAA
jgi:tRNA pseudouridine55 synthase